MRTLKFIVDKQIIRQDPTCDFSGLIPGTAGYLQAEFSFSSEWKDYTKVAAFYSTLGKEYEPRVLTDGKTCIIPAEALVRKSFRVRIVGKKEESKLTTNKITVCQKGGS